MNINNGHNIMLAKNIKATCSPLYRDLKLSSVVLMSHTLTQNSCIVNLPIATCAMCQSPNTKHFGGIVELFAPGSFSDQPS